MIKTSVIAGMLAGAFFAFAGPVQAAEDPITAPIEALLAPVLGPDAAAPTAAAAPKATGRHRTNHHAAGRNGNHVAWRGKGAGGYATAGRKQASLARRSRKSS